jgi:pimeloyl-ACP methyl ester carboxylesterase
MREGQQVADYVVTEGELSTPAGVGVFYRDFAPTAGSGRLPLLCLPGYWRSSKDYEHVAARLAPDRRVITPDMRGRGHSDRATHVADYHFDALVGDVWRLLDELEVERLVVLGTTLGGLMAMEMASRKPDRIVAVILNDVGPEGAPAASKRMSAFSGGDEYAFDDAVERIRAQNEATFPGLDRDDWVRMMLRAYREVVPGRFVRDFDQLTNEETARFKADRPSFWTEFAMIARKPVAILRGQNSDYLTAEVADRMAATSRQVTLTTIPDRGHPPLLDEPESVSAIDELLKRAETAEGTPSRPART